MTTTLLGRLHSARQAATDARHTRERRPLHNRHSRAGGYPAIRSGIRPINSVSPPRRRRAWRSSVAGRGAIQLDLRPRRFRRGGRNDDYSTRQAATDARHTRERRPLHNRHSRAGGNPAARSGIRPINSVSPPRRRRTGRSSVAGRGGDHPTAKPDLRPRRFRRGGRNDDYSTRQATLYSAGGHRQPSYPRRRVSSGLERHSSHQLWNSYL